MVDPPDRGKPNMTRPSACFEPPIRVSAGLALALALGCVSIAHAGITSEGALVTGASGTEWSSDLGLDYTYPISPTAPVFGTGGTSPVRPDGYLFQGESIDNYSYYSSPAYLGSTSHTDIGSSGAVEGVVHHIHMENTVPGVGFYGLGAYSQVQTKFNFDGGTPGFATTVYFAYEWQITTDIPDTPGASISYLVNVGDSVEASGITLQNLSGNGFGSFLLSNCCGGNSFTGSGTHLAQFSFEAFNASGSSNVGGTSDYDVWFAFSTTPITDVPLAQTAPEPATIAALGLGLAGLKLARRRRAA